MIHVFQIKDQMSIFPKVSMTYGMGEIGMNNTDVLNHYANGLYIHVATIETEIPEVAFQAGNTGEGARIHRMDLTSMHSISVGVLFMLNGDLLVVAEDGFVNLGYPLKEIA